MVLVSSIGVDAAAVRRKGAEEGICVSIQTPDLARHSFEVLDTLRPLQCLTGRGSVFNSLVDSTRDERHCDRSWHGRQRLKRGVPPRRDTPSRSPTIGS